jgi:hypothetical protein
MFGLFVGKKCLIDEPYLLSTGLTFSLALGPGYTDQSYSHTLEIGGLLDVVQMQLGFVGLYDN